MFGPSLLGRTLTWRAAHDPRGTWVYSLDDRVLAELSWGAAEGLVRADTGDGLWRVPLDGTFLIRGRVESPRGAPWLLYAGGLGRGLAQFRDGRSFTLYSRLDRRHGAWVGIDDATRTGVVRILGRVGDGGHWFEVRVVAHSRFRDCVGPLLLLWGGLRILRRRRPWLGVTTAGVSERWARRALDGLRTSLTR